MGYKETYKQWLMNDYFDEDIRIELERIKDNEKEIEDRFYKDLEFGTGGLRGVIGAGTNRMNIYTVRRATQGFANYLINQIKGSKDKGIAIAYDSRFKSAEFAKEAALVMIGSGIKVYLFESLRTTPELSFAVRDLGCAGGIVITASHNPSEYNGYKVYGEDGCQLVPHLAEMIIEEIRKINDYKDVKYVDEKDALSTGMLEMMGENVDKKYIDQVKSLVLREDMIKEVGKDFKIIYTPLHGTGNMPVRRVLREIGFENVMVVPEQELPDSNFSTVEYPNPEERDSFELALKLAEKEGAELLLGTDPDCDRVGVIVKNRNGEYEILTGNQTGALLVDYVLSGMKEKETLPNNAVVIKTIVTSEMGATIARSYGVDTLDTLTGFKFIGEKIGEFEKSGEKEFVFGYEESYGYLAGTFVRDKDAVVASMLICEMGAYYKSKGMTLYDALIELYERYGYYKEDLVSITLKGKEGLDKIQSILEYLREHTPKTIGDKKVNVLRDYKESKARYLITGDEDVLKLPKSNVLHFTLEDGSWFCVRPSGTEPKVKFYFSVTGDSLEDSENQLKDLKDHVMDMIHDVIK